MIFLCQFSAVSTAASKDDIIHQESINQAHNGNYGDAIFSLKKLSNKYPKPNRFFYDLILILGWAGEYQQAASYYDSISLEEAPRYVLYSIAITLRQQLNHRSSEEIYLALNKRFPDFLDGEIGLGLVLIDQNKFQKARKILFPLLRKHPSNIDLLNAIAYFHESQQQFLPALSIYKRIVSLDPDNTTSLRKKILTLNQLGASHLAYSLIKDPSLFSNDELARIKADMAAHRIRWGAIPTIFEKDRFNEIEIAIHEIESNIKNVYLKSKGSSLYLLNDKFDLLVALRNRYRMEETIALYKQLKESNIDIPAYAQIAACDAFLYLELPDKAENCYTEAKYISTQENINIDLSLFYAYLENERFPVAQRWIKHIAEKQPSYIFGKGKKPLKKPNPKKTQAETISSLSIAFGDELAIAEQQIKTWHDLAPYNTDLRKELANIYYWRGWPRKAQEEYDIGLNQEPKHIGLRLGQSRNHLELKKYEKAEQSINSLYEIYPEDKGIARRKKLWGIHNMREFKTDINTSRSSGGINGSRSLEISSYLYSAPINKNYRPYIHQRHSQVKFTEGDGLLNHAGIGLEYTAPSVLLMAELHHNHFEDNRIGININGEYEFNDRLSSSFALESLSKETPLRALNQGVYARSASFGGQYRWHESRSTGVNLSYQDYSDGNERKSVSGYWNERWYNQYNYKFSTRVDLFTSRNSKIGAIYFNPESDLAGSIALENDWLSWRSYENTFHQRLILSTGFYKQEDFSSGDTWGVQYEHRWTYDHRLELLYGIKRSSNLYDGDHELSWTYYLSLDWRF